MPKVVPSQVVGVIDRMFPRVEERPFVLNHGHSSDLTALIDLIDAIPPELLALEPDRYVEFIASCSAIRDALQKWRSGDRHTSLNVVQGFPAGFPLVLIRRALAACPDEFPAQPTAELTFIQDADLRQQLRLDISATNRALANGEWKAATVLAGSVIEALLLWRLQQCPAGAVSGAVQALIQRRVLTRNPGPNLEDRDWNLHAFVEVAAELGILSPESAAAVRQAKDFRNLIHPGRAQRLGQACNRGTALAAVAALEFVIQAVQ